MPVKTAEPPYTPRIPIERQLIIRATIHSREGGRTYPRKKHKDQRPEPGRRFNSKPRRRTNRPAEQWTLTYQSGDPNSAKPFQRFGNADAKAEGACIQSRPTPPRRGRSGQSHQRAASNPKSHKFPRTSGHQCRTIDRSSDGRNPKFTIYSQNIRQSNTSYR